MMADSMTAKFMNDSIFVLVGNLRDGVSYLTNTYSGFADGYSSIEGFLRGLDEAFCCSIC